MKLPAPLALLLGGLADIIAPARCMGCLRETTWLCPACRARVGTYPLSCIVCTKAHPRGLTCETCRSSTPLAGVISVGGYRNLLLQRGVGWLKYKGVHAVAPLLASLLLPRLLVIAPWQELHERAVFIPIPLHPKKQRERGFNQSTEIARALSKNTGIPTLTMLGRHRSTWTQSKLPKELRHENMQHAFAVTERLPVGRSMAILIDDVTTTGSTLTAAAHTLHQADVPLMWGATIARG